MYDFWVVKIWDAKLIYMWYFLDISSFILFAGFMEIIILSSSLIDDDDVDGVGKLTINHVVTV